MQMGAIGATMPFLIPDIITTILLCTIISLATGSYAGRFHSYIKGLRTGEMGRVRGLGIQTQTYDANLNRKGGIKID
jgi:hypothetical protein